MKLDYKFLACQIASVALLMTITTTVFAQRIKSKSDLGLALQNDVLCRGKTAWEITHEISIEVERRRGKGNLDDMIRSVSLKPSALKDLSRLGVKANGNGKIYDFYKEQNFIINLELPSGIRIWGYEVNKVVITGYDSEDQDFGQSIAVTIQATAADLKTLKSMLRLEPLPKDQPFEDDDYGSVKYLKETNAAINADEGGQPDTIVLGLPKHADGTHIVIGCEYGTPGD